VKKFKFRMQKVLEYKDQLKKEGGRELARKHYALSEAEDALEQAQAQYEALGGDQSEIGTMAELALTQAYKEIKKLEITTRTGQMQDAEQAVDTAKEQYVELRKDARAMTLLREKKQEQHREDVKRDGRKELNDLALQRFSRGSKWDKEAKR